MSTPIEAVIDEIVAVSASVAPWAPPLTRDQAADLLASYARHALGLSKDLPAGSSELFPRAYRPKRVASLGLGPVYATPAPVKVAPVLPIAPPAAPIAAPKPPPLPVKAVEAAPSQPEYVPTVAEVEIEDDLVDVSAPGGLVTDPDDPLAWKGSPPASVPPFSPAVMAQIEAHYAQNFAVMTFHALNPANGAVPPALRDLVDAQTRRFARPQFDSNGISRIRHPRADLPVSFVAIAVPKGVYPPRIDGVLSRRAAHQSDEMEVHFLSDNEVDQAFEPGTPICVHERRAIDEFSAFERARMETELAARRARAASRPVSGEEALARLGLA